MTMDTTNTDQQVAQSETPEQVANRICRYYLDSERVSVTQFCDIEAAITAVLKKHDDAIRVALEALKSEHVLPNLFRLGLLGKQEIEGAIDVLEAIREGR